MFIEKGITQLKEKLLDNNRVVSWIRANIAFAGD